MEKMRDKQIVQQIIDHSLSGIPDDPWLAQRVLSDAKKRGEIVVMKKKTGQFGIGCYHGPPCDGYSIGCYLPTESASVAETAG